MKKIYTLAALAATAVLPPFSSAEEVHETSKSSRITQMDDVVVRGEAVNLNLMSTSATVLHHEDMANRVFITPLDMVTSAPGISIDQYKQGGTAANFTMRGFSGNSHGPNTAIYLDGILLNEGDGYADTNIINPEEMERAEIIKGPASALYGNYASAGTLSYYTKKRAESQKVKLHYGSHNTYEANYVGGFSNEQGDYVFSLQNYHTDGYQDNSNWDKMNAATRLSRRVHDDMTVRLSLRGFNSDWDAPGYLSGEQLAMNRKQAISETNGGSKDRIEGRIDMDYRINSQSKGLFYLWSSSQNFKRWFANNPDGRDPDYVVGNLRDFDRFVYGFGGNYNFIGNIKERELHLTAGFDYMVEDDSRKRWRLLAGTGREKGDQFFNYYIDMNSLGIFAESNYQVLPSLRVITGIRIDHFNGNLTDHLENSAVFDMADQTIFSPKLGAVYSLPEYNSLEIFTNYSQGFALMPGFSEMLAFKQENWDPQKRTQVEAGFRVRPQDWISGEVTLYQLKTSKDFVELIAGSGEYENVGKTTRQGAEIRLGLYAFDYGYIHADYAYMDASYDVHEAGGVSYAGKHLRGVPKHIINLEAGYSPLEGFGGRLRYHWVDGHYLDDANLYSTDSWGRWDAQASYLFSSTSGRKYRLALDILNLLNNEYVDYTGGSVQKTYSPSLPLSAYVTVNVEF